MSFSKILTGFIAFQHLCFMIIEMFLWDKPLGLKIFKHDIQTARQSSILAKNQGIYNGFLSAGLIWSLVAPYGASLQIFFLSCVLMAGVVGGVTAAKEIFLIQGLPALVNLLLAIYFQV